MAEDEAPDYDQISHEDLHYNVPMLILANAAFLLIPLVAVYLIDKSLVEALRISLYVSATLLLINLGFASIYMSDKDWEQTSAFFIVVVVLALSLAGAIWYLWSAGSLR